MNMMLKLVEAAFLEENIPVTVDEENEWMVVKCSTKNCNNILMAIIFPDETSVTLRAIDYCKVPEDKMDLMYKVCSQANTDYRWVKFSVSEEEGDIVVTDDAMIDMATCTEEVLTLFQRMLDILDDAYPIFMKAIWA